MGGSSSWSIGAEAYLMAQVSGHDSLSTETKACLIVEVRASGSLSIEAEKHFWQQRWEEVVAGA